MKPTVTKLRAKKTKKKTLLGHGLIVCSARWIT